MRLVSLFQLMALATLTLFSSCAFSGLCDLSWDGNKLGEGTRGQPLTDTQRLTDSNNVFKAQLSVAQIQAFFEAKEAIARQLGRSPNFVFCNDTRPNAFAMPTGNGDIVGVTIGMAKLVDGDRDMAAIVIGHEYAHLVKGHGYASQTADTIGNLAGAIVAILLESKIQKDMHIRGLGTDLANIGTGMALAKFSRNQEREADELGFDYMIKAGFNPMGAVRLSKTMNSEGAGSIGLFFDSHPGWEERGSLFSRMIDRSSLAQSIIAGTGEATKLNSQRYANTNVQNGGSGSVKDTEVSPPVKAFNDGLARYRQNDFKAAEKLFRTGASYAHADSQFALGVMYENGNGVSKDENKAVEWYRNAAVQGHAGAQAKLGWMYEFGQGGLPKDDVLAVEWYRNAAERGNAKAQLNLGRMHEFGRGGLRSDFTLAVSQYEKAAMQGDAQAQCDFGRMLIAGWGTNKNHNLALENFKKSAASGNSCGINALGWMYENGQGGLPKDDAMAVELYSKAADLNNSAAQFTLGNMYENARGGLSKDTGLAVEWYKKAATNGSSQAKLALERLKKSE